MTSRLQKSNISSQIGEGRKRNMSKSLEEEAYDMEIHPIEAERLRKTFIRMCTVRQKNGEQGTTNQLNNAESANQSKNSFDKKDLIKILTDLQFPYNKPELDRWIWEIDEDLDGCINEYEFTLMYKRCIFDKTWLEPRNLFNLIQFLMYDLTCRGKITVEDTLELIYVRHPDQLELHLFDIFGDQEKTEDGQQREIFFQQYLEQMRKRDLNKRKKLEEQRRTVKTKLKKDDDEL